MDEHTQLLYVFDHYASVRCVKLFLKILTKKWIIVTGKTRIILFFAAACIHQLQPFVILYSAV